MKTRWIEHKKSQNEEENEGGAGGGKQHNLFRTTKLTEQFTLLSVEKL